MTKTEIKKAFKIVNAFIKKNFPFCKGKAWDKKNGNLHFILGVHCLEEYIEALADDGIAIKEEEIPND